MEPLFAVIVPPHTRKQCSECSTYLHALKNLRKHETLPLSSPPHPLSQGIEPKAILSENSPKGKRAYQFGSTQRRLSHSKALCDVRS